MTYYTSQYTSPAPSATASIERTVADKMRALFPGNYLACLVQSGLARSSEIKNKAGLIKKRMVLTPKYEVYTYTPLAITFTVTVAGTTSATVSSGDGLTETMTLLNTKNMTTARVSANTSGALTLVSFGSTSFSCAIGDVLLAMGPAYKEGSSTTYILQKDEDNSWNTLQIMRYPIAISASAAGNPHYAGGNVWSRIKRFGVLEGMRKTDNTLFFGNRASSGLTTTDSTLSDTFRSTRGLWNWAGTSVNVGGSLTHAEFCQLNQDFPDTIGMDDKLLAFGGKKPFGTMQSWVRDKLVQVKDGELKKFGVTSRIFMTDGPEIDYICHDAFDRGSLSSSVLIINPALVEYVHKKDRDLKPVKGIQTNKTDGYEDEVKGEIGIDSNDAGNQVIKVINWSA